MKKMIFAALVATFAALAAHATPGGEGNNTGCNGVGNANSPCAGSGATGGAGGTGVGIGVGIAAAQANAAALAASNASANASANQVQGQQQGQSQSSRNTNDNRSSATGGAATAAATGGTSGGNTMTVQGDTLYAPAQERNPVSTAYAAPLTASNGTCMGSSSAGAQGAAVGLSFGTTWTDASCDIRYDAEALRAAGLPLAARARLCQKSEIAKAMEDAGTPCPKARAAAVQKPAMTADAPMPWQAGG